MADILLAGLLTLSPGANSGPPQGGKLAAQLLTDNDFVDGGTHYVAGTVGIDGTPDVMVHRRVRLICMISGRLVRETWSDPVTGAYRFDHVRSGPWTVLAHDYLAIYNAVVADNILGLPE